MLANIEDAHLLGTANLTLDGSDASNALYGNAGRNTINGGMGDDLIDGGAGGDLMSGGPGRDTFVLDSTLDYAQDLAGSSVLWSHVDIVLGDMPLYVDELELRGKALLAVGTEAPERIVGNTLANFLAGGAGDDTLLGGMGTDLLSGDDGDDELDAGEGDDVVFGQDGDDRVLGGDGNDSLSGETGDDLLDGGAGDDVLAGGPGSDTLRGGTGADTLVGGAGDDRYEDVNADDLVLELPDGGFDVIVASTSVDLAGGVVGLESVELTGSADLGALGTANADRLVGNAGANLIDGRGGNDTLEGGDGFDSMLGGSGADSITGGAGDDTLQGNEGADFLDGGAGADSMAGGAGDDTYVLDGDPGDVVQEAAGDGSDTVRTPESLLLASIANVESASLTGSADSDLTGTDVGNRLEGNAGANELLGLGGDDVLMGNEGADLLDGGVGADTMAGGPGLDTYRVDSPLDVVQDVGDNTADVVETTADYTLPSGVNVAIALGSANLSLAGSFEADLLVGNGGDNRLEGQGGDTLQGGLGDDTYVLPSEFAVFTVVELADAGNDWVLFTRDTLALTGSLANVENAAVLPGASYVPFTFKTITGNGFANRLEGGIGRDLIDGAAGADTMAGGTGDDTYVVDDLGDEVQELADSGTRDEVRIGRTISLSGQFAHIERVQLEGSDAADITGNAADNSLGGNAGSNRIDGGAGADTMFGGNGDDTYVVDSIGDVVAEDGAGVDRVESEVSFSLAGTVNGFAVGNVENLRLTGSAAIDGTGNALANAIEGNAGSNRLLGGAGDDTLTGGDGADTLSGGGNADQLFGGSGDDLLYFDFDGDSRLHGGSGTDTLVVSGAGALLFVNGNIGTDRLYDGLEVIDLGGTGNNTLGALFANDVLALSEDDRLVVKGNAGDQVSVVGAEWTEGAQQSLGTDFYRTFTSNTAEVASLWIDADVTVTLV